ncbi:MAG: HAMP domain-containing histidine kinase [Thermoleophilia bacterium]|nr:HAMP domain-containing histidine kinase [Thermoleophilia bacterium]
MSLRLRITLATTVALVLVAVASAVAIYLLVGAELRSQTADTLRDIAVRSHAPGGHDSDPDDVDGTRHPEELGGPTGYLQSIAADGTVTRDKGDTTALPVDSRDLEVARTGRGEVVHDNVDVDGVHLLVLTVGRGEDGALQVARPLDEVDRILEHAATLLVAVTLMGVIVAVLLGQWLGRVALKPIASFTRQAEAITHDPRAKRRLEVSGRDEVSRLASSFNATLDALEASLHAQQQLIADAGHELRTPIASIRANVQVLEDADRLPPRELAALRSDIVTELDELTELLGDVIELARASDPEAPMDDVRLDEVVRAAADRATRRADSDVTIELDLQPTVVRGHSARIARAVANVIDNARKWSPGGGTVEITLVDGVVRVRDHGPGFPADSLDHVFDRFWRAPAARSMPGSGLGLAIVEHAAHQHGGVARAGNDPDGGAVVEVSFGAASAPADA